LDNRVGTSEERRAERVQRLLAGEPLDTSELNYDFNAHHLGVIASGPGAADAIRGLADSFDCRLLLVCRDERAAWAWLGARRRVDPIELERLAVHSWPPRVPLAIGEPSQGLTGWRLTHRQAQAAMAIAVRSPKSLIRYVDVALLASMAQDDLLATSLRELYLIPLSAERDGGAVLRETLRAYFSAERNLSSAAAALGVNRRTVANRLRVIEARLGRPLAGSMADIEAALRLDRLDATSVGSANAPKGD
jgi:hypothetical protein